MSIYAWCEDRGSGFQFWNAILKMRHPDIIVETKTNNSQLRKAAGAVIEDGNEYYILMDTFVDNADILRELDGLKRSISGKHNVHVVDIRSFEFVLLSFQLLIQWVFAEQDELRDARVHILRARDLFVEQVTHNVDMDAIVEFEELFPYAKSHNNEQVAAELLYQITRNTGFETTKGKLGECFIIDCCEWASRQSDDLCGLDTDRLTATEKKRQLVERSVLKTALEKAGI